MGKDTAPVITYAPQLAVNYIGDPPKHRRPKSAQKGTDGKVSERQHAARIRAMKRYQVEPWQVVKMWPPDVLIPYLRDNCKGMAMQYNEQQFLELVDRVADLLVSGRDADHFLETREDRNHTWERNHRRILRCVTTAIEQAGAFPAVTTIARQLSLTRNTVTRHLEDLQAGNRTDQYGGKTELLRERAMGLLYDLGLHAVKESDQIKALKTLTDITRPTAKPATVNLIQINNVFITADQLASLPQDAQRQIAEIVMNAG